MKFTPSIQHKISASHSRRFKNSSSELLCLSTQLASDILEMHKTRAKMIRALPLLSTHAKNYAKGEIERVTNRLETYQRTMQSISKKLAKKAIFA